MRLRQWFLLAIDPVGLPGRLAEGAPEFWLDGAEHDVATVACRIDTIIGGTAIQIGGLRLRHALVQRGKLVQLQRHRDVGDAEIDVAAQPVAPTRLQRAEDGDHREQSAGHVRDRRIEAARRYAVAVQHTGKRQIVAVVPGRLRRRALRAVTAQGTVDQPGVPLAHGRVIEPEPLHDTGPESLDQHIGLRRQRQQRCLARVILQIEPAYRLAGIQRRMEQRCTIGIARSKLHHAIALWWFDLQHLGTEVGEQQAGERSRTDSWTDRARARHADSD